jgi:RimJ/RimL family protein N-acetyltransferase
MGAAVLLRPWSREDLDALWEALQDPDIRAWNGSGSASPEAALSFIHDRQDWSNGSHASWAISLPDTRTLIGSVSLHRIDRDSANAEIGYWTSAAARGRGAATDGVMTVCRWAFDELRLERIELRHALENHGSARVAQKSGFTQEGHLRRSYRYPDGLLHDELLWARLKHDA